jgi:Rrf2 family protein
VLTRTSITATRLLMHLASLDSTLPAVLASAAQRLEESPTYLAKVARLLVRAGILRASRGVGGGVTLNRAAADVTFLSIVEACQGAILPDFCQAEQDLRRTCAFHQAAAQLHESIIKVLAGWTLADFMRRPGPSEPHIRNHPCWIHITRTAQPLRRGKEAAK